MLLIMDVVQLYSENYSIVWTMKQTKHLSKADKQWLDLPIKQNTLIGNVTPLVSMKQTKHLSKADKQWLDLPIKQNALIGNVTMVTPLVVSRLNPHRYLFNTKATAYSVRQATGKH